MVDRKKATEIADEDLDMHGGEGSVSSLDALLVINDLSRVSEDTTALNPSRTYSVTDGKEQVLLNPSRTYKGPVTKG
ncbi:MAG: hypothetical protein AAF479_10120 [Pseudomonadota bacterium]